MNNKLNNYNVCAIILAAGYSSRMKKYKPLLTFGGDTLLSKLIKTYKKSHVENIVVVTGHNDMMIEKEIKKFDSIKTVYNECFDDGMYSSVLKGIASMDGKNYDGYIINPVDCPLVRTVTINRLVSEFYNCMTDCVSPKFCGIKGHPVIVSSGICNRLLDYKGGNGLKGALDFFEVDVCDIEVRDSFVLDDIDNSEDYHKVLDRRKEGILNKEEIIAAMKTIGVNNEIISHCEKVAEVSVGIARKLNHNGCSLDIELIQMAALMHDIKRDTEQHALEGEFYISEMGCFEVADIVSEHMNFASDKTVLEEKHIVYFSDKIVKGAKIVTLEERFEGKMNKFRGTYLYKKILKKYKDALDIKEQIESRMNENIYNVVLDYEKKNDFFNEACRNGIS